MRLSLLKRIIYITITIPLLCIDFAYAGDLGIGLHAGYGIVVYSEKTSSFGTHMESRSSQPLILTGISGEYSYNESLFINLTTDWATGLEGREVWKEDGIKTQGNDMKLFGQFYDLRLGYKDAIDNIYYRVYASGGWDGINFKRDDFIVNGSYVDGDVEEDFSLIRVGIGGGAGYKIGRFAIDGRLAYSYYPYASIRNSALSGFKFNTNGTCFDGGAGVAYQIVDRLNLYAGYSYTLLKLNESDVIRKNSIQAIFPESRTEIKAGIINLTYKF